jgi:hypothetical protein
LAGRFEEYSCIGICPVDTLLLLLLLLLLLPVVVVVAVEVGEGEVEVEEALRVWSLERVALSLSVSSLDCPLIFLT